MSTLGTAQALFVTLRPQQWVKNSLLFAALIFSQNLFSPAKIAVVAAAFSAFCLLASGVYVFNDIRDVEEDKRHPVKRKRPIPSGALPIGLAWVAAFLLMAAGGAGSLALGMPFFGLACAYLALNLAYSTWLKHIVILDVMAISAGFVIRAVAGGVVIGVEVSSWLIICTILLALLLALGKRRHEIVLLNENASSHRPILDEYSPYFLDQMIGVVTPSTLVAYCLYTLSPDVQAKLHVQHLEITVPFVIYGIFRYLYLVHQKGEGGSPTHILLTDRPLLINIALWIATAVLLLYGHVFHP